MPRSADHGVSKNKEEKIIAGLKSQRTKGATDISRVQEKKKKTEKKRKRIRLGLFDQVKAQGPNCFLHPQGPGPVGPIAKDTRISSTNQMSNSFP